MRLGSADPGYTLRRTAAKRQFGRLENVFVFFFLANNQKLAGA